MITDNELAWKLADTFGEALRTDDRMRLYIELGADEPLLAIERVLISAGREDTPLERALITTIDEWLDRYVGFAHERRMRVLLRYLATRSVVPATVSRRALPAASTRNTRLALAGTARAPGRRHPCAV